MIIPAGRHLLGVDNDQLKKILIPALKAWKGPCVKPRTPAEDEYQYEMLEKRDKLLKEIERFLTN